MGAREIRYSAAINEAIDICMADDPGVYIMGLGVPDPKGIFGTTKGLREKYGEDRVMDMPLAENAMTGVAIGSALVGMRPIMTHQRIDFALLAMEQIANQAANWHYMFAGQQCVPMVIRMIIGRGWGQGAQHSQSLQTWFAHIPGLKVVMPATPHDAKGLLIASIKDNNPVVFIEHRWLHDITGQVPEGEYQVPIGPGRILREGCDVTIAAVSYMSLEATRAAEKLERLGITAEVLDVRTLRPFDDSLLVQSVRKTGHLVVADTGWKSAGFSAEIVARVTEGAYGYLRSAPLRVALPDCPCPTTPSLANRFYPRAADLIDAVGRVLKVDVEKVVGGEEDLPLDVPDASFTGPF